jgi:hypothetical protein
MSGYLDTSTIASDKSSRRSGKNAITDDVEANAEADPEDNEEMVKEVDLDFVVGNYVGKVNKDSLEAPAELPALLSTDSLHEAVTTGLCKPTNNSGEEPPYNRLIALIDEHKAKNKAPLQLSEIARARVDTPFPIIYCTDLDNEFNND